MDKKEITSLIFFVPEKVDKKEELAEQLRPRLEQLRHHLAQLDRTLKNNGYQNCDILPNLQRFIHLAVYLVDKVNTGTKYDSDLLSSIFVKIALKYLGRYQICARHRKGTINGNGHFNYNSVLGISVTPNNNNGRQLKVLEHWFLFQAHAAVFIKLLFLECIELSKIRNEAITGVLGKHVNLTMAILSNRNCFEEKLPLDIESTGFVSSNSDESQGEVEIDEDLNSNTPVFSLNYCANSIGDISTVLRDHQELIDQNFQGQGTSRLKSVLNNIIDPNSLVGSLLNMVLDVIIGSDDQQEYRFDIFQYTVLTLNLYFS